MKTKEIPGNPGSWTQNPWKSKEIHDPGIFGNPKKYKGIQDPGPRIPGNPRKSLEIQGNPISWIQNPRAQRSPPQEFFPEPRPSDSRKSPLEIGFSLEAQSPEDLPLESLGQSPEDPPSRVLPRAPAFGLEALAPEPGVQRIPPRERL